ncbi:MAG TPA: hypothetical protein VI322_04260 [Candidatus Saccharimonadia bacterium]
MMSLAQTSPALWRRTFAARSSTPAPAPERHEPGEPGPLSYKAAALRLYTNQSLGQYRPNDVAVVACGCLYFPGIPHVLRQLPLHDDEGLRRIAPRNARPAITTVERLTQTTSRLGLHDRVAELMARIQAGDCPTGVLYLEGASCRGNKPARLDALTMRTNVGCQVLIVG